MNKTQPLFSPFNSQPAVFARVCVCRGEKLAAKPHRTVSITENLSASISTFTHMPFYR